MKYLLFDASNILYRTFYAHTNEDDDVVAGYAAHAAIITLNKYFKLFKPCKVIMCFDRKSWRKGYTASDECISQKPYKGNRRKNMTESQKIRYQSFLEHLGEFEELVKEYTSIIVMAGDGLEADDLIAGTIQTMTVKEPDSEFVIISADKDLIQLLKHDNVRLIDPATGNDRTLEDWNDDAKYFMFEKCIRGDSGDNVQSAYPRVRSTKIKKAYTDKFERTNIMMHEWTSPVDGRTFKVQDLFKENILLMDLEEQPNDIQLHIIRTVLDSMANPGEFSYFKFLGFLGKYKMKNIADRVESYVPMLSS